MLSRVADSIYWMGRYVERAENVARYIDVNLNLSLDLGPDMVHHWAPLVYITGDEAGFYERYQEATQANVVRFLTFDDENSNSIVACLRAARENARTIREIISTPVWEELNKFYLMVCEAQRDNSFESELFEFFGKIKLYAAILEGLAESTMSRGEAWHFRRMGRAIERADKTSRLLDVKYYLLSPDGSGDEAEASLDTIQWAALLKTRIALEMYRQKFGAITPEHVAEFLILNREFPRAVHFCLTRAEESMLAITGSSPRTYRTSAEQLLGRLRSEFDYAHIQEIMETGLHDFVDAFQVKLNRVGAAIHETFFASQPFPAVVAVERPKFASSMSQEQSPAGQTQKQTAT